MGHYIQKWSSEEDGTNTCDTRTIKSETTKDASRHVRPLFVLTSAANFSTYSLPSGWPNFSFSNTIFLHIIAVQIVKKYS